VGSKFWVILLGILLFLLVVGLPMTAGFLVQNSKNDCIQKCSELGLIAVYDDYYGKDCRCLEGIRP
jgi:hypothetical protein